MARIESLPIPDIQKRIVFQQYMSAGDLSPESLQKTLEEHVPPTILKEELEQKSKQEAALNALEQISKTGLGAQDRLALEQARRQAAQDSQARIASIASQMEQRGMSGAGQELATMLQAGQAADDRQAMENLQIAANAASNRQNALKDLFSSRSQMRAADLDVNKYNVGVQNEAQRFRTQNEMNRDLQNKQWIMQANMQNLQNKQQLQNANVEQHNKEQQRLGHDAKIAQYNMEMAKRQALAGLQAGQAQQKQQQAQSTAQNWSTIGGGAANMLGGLAQMQNANDLADKYIKAGMKPPVTAAHGAKIEGPEMVEGDHEMNDIVPAMLSPGEIVVPKSKAQHPDDAADFVAKLNGGSFEKKKDAKKQVMTNLSDLLKSLSELE